jgi:hypothetical protein
MSRNEADTQPLSGGGAASVPLAVAARLRLLHLQDAERALDSALDRFRRGEVSAEALTARARALQAAADRARAVAGLQAALERKYSPDQPRDDHGRWTSGGGVGHVLSADQRRVATVLWRDIQASGAITPASYARMQAAHLKIGDVMPPGLYQAEFSPQMDSSSLGSGTRLNVLDSKHSQFVYVDDAGKSQILSSGPGGKDGKALSALTGPFDGSGPHSLGTIVGFRREDVSINGVRNNTPWSDAVLWKKMNATAQDISRQRIGYFFLGPNSNSVFFSIASTYGLRVKTSKWTPGDQDEFSPHR